MMKLAPKILAENGVRNTFVLCNLLLQGEDRVSDFITMILFTAQQFITPHFFTHQLKGLTGCSLLFCFKVIGNTYYKIYI